MTTIQGRALVASPYLSDPNFMRSVVYILRHDEEGALGLVLNRPTSTNIGSLLEQLAERPVSNDQPVYYGGPVDGPLVMLQTVQVDGQVLVAVASDQDRILQVCEESDDDTHYRIFDGYSGWGAGQLEAELKQGGWLVWDIKPADMFADSSLLWQEAIREIGRDILSDGIDPSRIPDDPAYN